MDLLLWFFSDAWLRLNDGSGLLADDTDTEGPFFVTTVRTFNASDDLETERLLSALCTSAGKRCKAVVPMEQTCDDKETLCLGRRDHLAE